MVSLYKAVLQFFYPSLCLHCKNLTKSHEEMLCSSCLSFLSLEEMQGRCLTCFTEIDSSLCPLCSFRPRRISRQLATVEKMGPGSTLLYAAMQGDRVVFPAIAALMAYQWTRLSLPTPDLIVPLSCSRWSRIRVGFDPNQHLAKILASSLGIPHCLVLKRKWDREAFMTEGLVRSQFGSKQGRDVTDKEVLLISLSLDDLLIQQAAKALEPLFPKLIYSLSFA